MKIVAGERRLTMRLMGYWQDLRRNRRCALARDLVPFVPSDLLPDCFTFLPAKTLDDGEFCQIGEKLARISEVRTRSLAMSEVPGGTLLGIAARSLGVALKKGTPILDEGEFEDRKGQRNLYRAILLPLEDEQGEIVQVLGGARCKGCRDNAEI